MVIATGLNVVAVSVGPFVVTGRYFTALDRVEQAAIVAHETGHIWHRHALKRIWMLVRGRWKDIPSLCKAQEFEADHFATMNGHGHGLVKFLSRSTKPHESPLHPTSDERIRNIMRWLNGR